ncbi:MAG: anti-sigma factor antagonist [Solirubrobacteraceae bacterium]|jgi:anti-anti-sigma factor|nr:anti-sigma factor antagonist [Solirubrobacteraceae bacterium]
MAAPTEPSIERVSPPPADGVVVLALGGELDLAMHEQFHGLVDEVIAEQPRLVVADLTAAEFMDSTMLRELLRAHASLEEAGSRLVVVDPQPPVRRLFELTGTDDLLSLVGSREQALDGA